MKKLFPLFILLFVITSSGQSDQWRGLVIDEATSEQALALFGKPKSDKRPYAKYKKATPEMKAWRVLHYESIEGFNDVKLTFNDKDTMIMLQLEPKKITAGQFAASYPDIEFQVNTNGPGGMPGNVRAPQPLFTPGHTTQAAYFIEGSNSKVKISAVVANAMGSVFGRLIGSDPKTLPGEVKVIILSSQSINAQSQGSDLLK